MPPAVAIAMAGLFRQKRDYQPEQSETPRVGLTKTGSPTTGSPKTGLTKARSTKTRSTKAESTKTGSTKTRSTNTRSPVLDYERPDLPEPGRPNKESNP